MKPIETVKAWVEAFNQADAESLAGLYGEDALIEVFPEPRQVVRRRVPLFVKT
jgi:ketosteroid isomerase-like protein